MSGISARRLPNLIAEAGRYEVVQFGENDFELRMGYEGDKCRKVQFATKEEAMEVLELLASPIKVRLCNCKAANY